MNLHRVSIVYLLVVSECWGYIGGNSSQEDVKPHIYCGKVLARTVDTLKRSERTMYYNTILSLYYKEEEIQDWLMPSPKSKSLGFASKNKRFIVNECCEKPCRVSEFLTYC